MQLEPVRVHAQLYHSPLTSETGEKRGAGAQQGNWVTMGSLTAWATMTVTDTTTVPGALNFGPGWSKASVQQRLNKTTSLCPFITTPLPPVSSYGSHRSTGVSFYEHELLLGQNSWDSYHITASKALDQYNTHQ